MAADFNKSVFSGGMDLFTERTKLDEDKYALLINARSRFGKIRPIKKPLLLTEGLPTSSGNFQGLYGIGNFAVVFQNGNAYVRDFIRDASFSRLPNLQMAIDAETIYLEVVPASTINYTRAIQDTNKVNGSVDLLSTLISPSPVAAVVQDGVTQPWVILSNGIAKVTQGYSEWTNTATQREYVPIGKQMTYSDGILYIASPDGYQIYRSVSGRPLDFMVVIDAEGNKLPLDKDGNADNVSHRAFFEKITCMGKISSENGGFYVSSKRNSALVVPDFENTVYAEPTFRNINITNTGANNQFSFLGDVNGDSVFINPNGIKSFNSILQFKNEGRNSPFSLLISKLFNPLISQDITAAGQFDNYSCFAVNTVYGNVIVWYDELRQCWEAIDIYEEVTGKIKQFAEIITDDGERHLLFLTTTGQVYECFASAVTATARVYIGDFCSGDPKLNLKIGMVKGVFMNIEESGIIDASLYVDNQYFRKLQYGVTKDYTEDTNKNLTLPFGDGQTKTITTASFDFGRSDIGWSVGVFLEWNVMCNLTHIELNAETDNSKVSLNEQMKNYVNNNNTLANLMGQATNANNKSYDRPGKCNPS